MTDDTSTDRAGDERTATYVEDAFDRNTDYIGDRILDDPDAGHADPGQGPVPEGSTWPVEAGRYRLVVARACPWANRAVIVRRLLGLEDAISMGITGPTHDWRSWQFDLDPGGVDPVLGVERLRACYLERFPNYDDGDRGITVPAMVDIATRQVVTNDFPTMTLDFSTEWARFHRDGAPDLLPEEHRDEILQMAATNYHAVNDGVYRAGFAGTQEAYEQAYDQLFARLDELEERLSTQRYLVGDTITEADVRLWTTLVRFDAVYHNHFKCNRNKLVEMPALWGYARDLFQTPGFGDTIDFPQVKDHYYLVHTDLNPTGVVPKGPDLGGWLTRHGREELGGRPFGDGTPPGPLSARAPSPEFSGPGGPSAPPETP